MTAVACAFCTGDRPAADHRIADLGVTTAYLHDDQFFAGWVVLVLKRHATELFQLEADERARMMDDVARVAAAQHAVFIPRIHWHVIPRLADDPAPREAVWTVAHAPVSLTPAERTGRIAQLRTHLVR